MTPIERSDVRNYERTLGIQVIYRELPPLPRPIGLVTDVEAFLSSISASQPVADGPNAAATRSFSARRRRRGICCGGGDAGVRAVAEDEFSIKSRVRTSGVGLGEAGNLVGISGSKPRSRDFSIKALEGLNRSLQMNRHY